jgi:hypothetical protein|tara:strand:- start:6003 stop:7214 length:1212 start_codon:yes stop_codon:yes gene_type:complete
MASTYTALGVELQVTGENAGTWGDKTNTNLQLISQLFDGFNQTSIAGGAQTTALTVVDGNTTGTAQQNFIEFTGTITGNQIVTIPTDVEKLYVIRNSTSGAFTVEFKYASGSGSSVTFAATDKGTKFLMAKANDVTNPDIIDVNVVDTAGIQTLTNKTLTSPAIGTSILDTSGNELILLTATGSAVNEITLANAATGNGPTISASGETNVDLNLNPKGTGALKSGSAAVKIAGKETIWVPAQAMYGTTTNGAEAQQIETTATRPDLKVLDFDASTNEFAQFAVALPKSYNLGTVTFQFWWSPGNTNTGNVILGLQGVGVANDDTADIAFGTAVEVTDAGGGAIEDVMVSSESGAITIAGTPADDDLTFFQVFRNASDGSDTFTGDCRLLGIKLFITTDAANDA